MLRASLKHGSQSAVVKIFVVRRPSLPQKLIDLPDGPNRPKINKK